VRQQIDIYNSERRLLAWRIKAPAGLSLDWTASTGSSANGSAPVMVATTSQMPLPHRACLRRCRRAGSRGRASPAGRRREKGTAVRPCT
jgi:hypothetical protein